eukprot:TRINITY_DN12660_c0_g1_i1.p1 TRINITY_DN12660_c0_g1~~TRINITY_DN12660_c0_g1_i1.p1  ORF type:complete len:283 (+),score=46.38 TRINITY_DN12660_c0_g1_i1:592-1440(+)
MVIYFLQIALDLPSLQNGGSNDTSLQQDEEAKQLLNRVRRQSGFPGIREKLQSMGALLDTHDDERAFNVLLAGFFAFYNFSGQYSQCALTNPPFDWGKEVVSIRLGRRERTSSDEFEDLKGRFDSRLHIEDPFERSRNLADVVRHHPVDNVVKLKEQLLWMDHVCTVDLQAQELSKIAGDPIASATAFGAAMAQAQQQFWAANPGFLDPFLFSPDQLLGMPPPPAFFPGFGLDAHRASAKVRRDNNKKNSKEKAKGKAKARTSGKQNAQAEPALAYPAVQLQ